MSFIKIVLFLVFKKNEKKLVINCRKLNNVIITDSTSLLLIQNILNQLKKTKYFSKFDIKNAFNYIRIRKENK